MRKFHARQFSALIEPTVAPPASIAKRILPKVFCWTISPIGGAGAVLHHHP